MTESILMSGVVMGVMATVAMDIWAQLLYRFAGVSAPNWAMVGRWVAHMPRGQLVHDGIGAADAVPGELAIGWLFHYVVGIAYGVALAVIMGADWLAAPTFWPAWIFAMLTIGFGWFVMQPGMGLGWAASQTPNPWRARGLGLAAHTVFGVGMWLGALL
ncbi:DUF2938 domain-containing protein [uncultured Roseobacter sp.]|uniref:DUF2938 domain-containing protein n=1 Tax=uncultured Roseobacter sp. TaxID=114847 RepID=UPI00262AF80D|nr:DUF2938 domain-containing protein [uncultured Roseobacter sp.]